MMMISEHLSVREFLHTDHPGFLERQLDYWEGNPDIRANAYRMADEVFEPVREMLGCPLMVTSGLRCPDLNTLVGGKPNSRHMYGLALDLIPLDLEPLPSIYVLLHAIRRGQLSRIDQVIVEGSHGTCWLHLQASAMGKDPRRLVMESEDGRVFTPVV